MAFLIFGLFSTYLVAIWPQYFMVVSSDAYIMQICHSGQPGFGGILSRCVIPAEVSVSRVCPSSQMKSSHWNELSLGAGIARFILFIMVHFHLPYFIVESLKAPTSFTLTFFSPVTHPSEPPDIKVHLKFTSVTKLDD